jgi:hypothetical protein
MSAFNEDEVESTDEGMKQLRKAYRELKKSHDEVTEALKGFKAKESKSTVESVLREKGLNPLLAGLYKEEDASKEAITAWVETYGAAFGAAPVDGAGESGSSVEDGAATAGADDGSQNEAKRLQAATSGGSAPAAGEAAQINAIKGVKDEQELTRLLLGMGALT